MDKVVVFVDSMHRWTDPDRWVNLLGRLEEALGAPLTHLDDNDPVRKKVYSLSEAAERVTRFREREDCRWLFGRYASIRGTVSIQHQRVMGRMSNKMHIYLPIAYCRSDSGIEALRQVFLSCVDCLNPFYGLADLHTTFASVARLDGWPVNTEKELLGVFWHTYISNQYLRYLRTDRMSELPGTIEERGSGFVIRLADRPEDSTLEKRSLAVDVLGADSFASPTGQPTFKRKGQFVPTLEQLMKGGD